ncbi:hypothetical protein DUNSADRAFT_1932 [Dunaliella salina]|uniref:Uncharacterized protein n=1 Tax=Dunaliella salina TaxID=3046 RepID=A0ABQ7FWV2_DUNSA|nr:hypothetical protein DUNSADRAFT_1932 [Dunaliella salina]|eukprot:KAF5826826.1 hypothetical protein DUNSADRAFT_1932 [Dunaliella salina]
MLLSKSFLASASSMNGRCACARGSPVTSPKSLLRKPLARRAATAEPAVLQPQEEPRPLSGNEASTSPSSSNNWAVIQISNGPQRPAFSQFVEVGRAICVQARALSHKVGERIRFTKVMAYKHGNEQLRRRGKKDYLTTVCVEGVVADEFPAPTPAHKEEGLTLQKVLITKIEDSREVEEEAGKQ